MNSNTNCSINNIYKLEGRVPIAKAIPFGLQHILAMFVSNLAPITIIAGAAQPALSQAQTAILLQNAMFVAGIATMIQLYPIWRIGSKLPVVMGVSFTFVTVLSTIAANYGYPAVVGAVLIGGIFEGTLGLLAKYWRRIITLWWRPLWLQPSDFPFSRWAPDPLAADMQTTSVPPRI